MRWPLPSKAAPFSEPTVLEANLSTRWWVMNDGKVCDRSRLGKSLFRSGGAALHYLESDVDDPLHRPSLESSQERLGSQAADGGPIYPDR